MQRPTYDCTDEQILALPYFDLLAASGENRNLPCDVESYSLGDGIIHLILPEDVPEMAVAVYIRDIEGTLLARRVYDFTQKVMIGPWEVVLDHPTLPVLYFETEDPDVYDAMNASETKDIICNGNMHICVGKEMADANNWYREYLSTSDEPSKKTTASLQGRGYASWRVKYNKSYSLRLDKAQNLLGMGKNRNWNLIGNPRDLSLVKNDVFNDMSKKIGIEYQPGRQNVDLFVDGKYSGVYTLTTKVSVDKDRVALRKGDYFYRLDPPLPEVPIQYTSSSWFFDSGQLYPVADLMYPENPSPEKYAEASAILQNFINLRDNPALPGFENVCDLTSLARYYWIQEISMNFDACSRSTYMYYKHTDAKIHFGPVWDMDYTLGSRYEKQGVDYTTPTGWKIRDLGWYRPLFERPEFVAEVIDTYYNGGVREAMLEGIDDFEGKSRLLGDDGYLNYLFFGHANDQQMELIYGDSYEEYVENMIEFYRQRVLWIDAAMASSP